MDHEPIFWLGHLVGYLEDVVGETQGFPFSKRHGRFTPFAVECPATKEFLRLVDHKQRILTVNASGDLEHFFNFDSARKEAWIVSRQRPRARRTEKELELPVDEIPRTFAALRQNVLDAISDGERDCAYALTRELVWYADQTDSGHLRNIVHPRPTARPPKGWYLESFVEGNRPRRHISVFPFPFRVGRSPDLNLTLNSESVSKQHAELFLEDGVLRVFDLGSRNGTFVNGEQVEQSPLREGDYLRFAHLEFRVGRQVDESPREA